MSTHLTKKDGKMESLGGRASELIQIVVFWL
jgi:hypothetical protein